ncbi:MAG: hypothetical protein V3V02_01990 [Rhizobiaceae bacterium]
MSDDHNVLLIPVQLTMVDGRKLDGQMVLSIGGEVERTMNNTEANVIVFRDADGQRFITKSYIVELIEKPKERR